jgi:hypothetical protein
MNVPPEVLEILRQWVRKAEHDLEAAGRIMAVEEGCRTGSASKEDSLMFDAKQPISIHLRTPEGVKPVRVRFPTDEEWIDRQKRRKVIVKQLGRGVSETTIPDSAEADAALLAKIRVPEENAPEVDAFEASRIIEQLSQADVDDVVQVGDGFHVTMAAAAATARWIGSTRPRHPILACCFAAQSISGPR